MQQRSPFASRNVVTIPIPGLEGQTATIRALAGRHLDAARQESMRKSLALFKDMDMAAIKQVTQVTGAQIADATAADPLIGYDEATLIQRAVVAWTLGEQPPTIDDCQDLDEDTKTPLAREVLRWSKPSLFKTVDELEADQKNG